MPCSPSSPRHPSSGESAEQLYLSLVRFRGLLENASGARNWDANRRQLDLLSLIKEIVDRMSSGFASARSGLNRLAVFGAAVQAGEPYRSLSDLLSYDARLASVSLQVAVGADGQIRGFEIVGSRRPARTPS